MAKKIEVIIAGDASKLASELKRAGADLDGFGSRSGKGAKRLATLKTAAKGAAIGGIALAGVALKSSADAAVDAEKTQARLEAQLRASGISYKRHGKEIDAVIQKTSRLSGLDDEDLTEAFTSVVRSSGSVSKGLKGVGLAADIARAKHMDVSKAGDLVAKVYAGNTNALKRYGVQVEKGATVQEAVAAAQAKFGGQAEAYGKTAAGAQERFQVAVENLQEKIGGALLPVISDVATAVSKFVEQMSTGEGAGGKFVSVITTIAGILGTVGKVVYEIIAALVEFTVGVVKVGIAVVETAADIVTFFVDLPGKIVAAISEGATALGNAGQWIANQVKAGVEFLKDGLIGVGKWMVNRLAEGIMTITEAVGNIGGWIKNRVKDGVEAVADTITGIGSWIIGKVVGGITGATGVATEIGNFLKEKLDGVLTVTKGLLGSASDIGGKIGGAIISGVKAALGAGKDLINAVIDLINDAIPNKIKMPGPLPDVNLPDDPIPRFATGTPFAPSGLALVGERGPELVQMRGGERVYDAGMTREMIGGRRGGGDIHVHGDLKVTSDSQARALANQLAYGLKFGVA